MKLVHCNLSNQIILKEYGVAQWIIEDPYLFGQYVQELYNQASGAEGRFVLSDQDKELNIAKKVEMVMNPLLVDLNGRKILNKLYSDLSEMAVAEEFYLETQKVVNLLQAYFYTLEQECEHTLEIEQDIQLTEVFKAMGVHILSTSSDFFENIIEYIKVVAVLLEKQVILFVNAIGYFTQEQLKMIHETAVYNEIRVLFIDSAERYCDFGGGKYIIDRDQCEI